MAFEELKAQQAAMWGAGPFERVAAELHAMHELMVDAVEARPDDVWLDIGCGTGELAFLATRTGATIRGADISTVMIDTARRQASERGHQLEFEVADCEALPYPDASYDVVTSSVGVIFAPDHGRVAAELARVLRPGGRLALTAWLDDGDVGDFFRIIASYAPPPAPGAGSPIAWGDEAHCERLLGEAFVLSLSRHELPWTAESPEDLWEVMSEAFGPIVTLLRRLSPEQAAGLRRDVIALFARGATEVGVSLPRPFLLVQGTRRS